MLSPPLTYNIDCLHVCLLPLCGSNIEAGTVFWSCPSPPAPATGWHQEWDCEMDTAGSFQQKLLGVTMAICYFDKSETFLETTYNL